MIGGGISGGITVDTNELAESATQAWDAASTAATQAWDATTQAVSDGWSSFTSGVSGFFGGRD